MKRKSQTLKIIAKHNCEKISDEDAIIYGLSDLNPIIILADKENLYIIEEDCPNTLFSEDEDGEFIDSFETNLSHYIVGNTIKRSDWEEALEEHCLVTLPISLMKKIIK